MEMKNLQQPVAVGNSNGEPRRSLQHPPSARNSRHHVARPDTAESRAVTPGPIKNKGGFVGAGYGTIDGPKPTTIDVIAVPCIGACPFKTWHGDNDTKQPPDVKESWVTTRIRQTFKLARVLMYQHRDLEDGQVLDVFARDLLEAIHDLKEKEAPKMNNRPRPLFFICHSIGGLVVKIAMQKAGGGEPGFEEFKPIWKDTYSIAFFGTPHFGSKFLATKMLTARITQILGLRRSLPQSIRKQLEPSTARKPNEDLDDLNKKFRLLVGEMWIWTFTEARELSFTVKPQEGKEVTFWEPVTSFKSAVIGYRHEIIRPVARATHSSLAYFADSEDLTARYLSWFHYFYEKASFMIQAPFALGAVEDRVIDVKDEVVVEIRGVFQGEGDSQAPGQQYWTARCFLRDVINKGPIAMLSERLDKVTSSNSSQSENIISDETEERAPARTNSSPHLASPLTSVDYLDETMWDEDDEEDSEQGVIEDKPSMQALLYTWVHLPWNNPVWVPDLLAGVNKDCPLNLQELEKDQHWGSLFANGRLNSHHSKFMAPGCGLILMNPFDTTSTSAKNVLAYVHFPYLHFDSYRSVVRRRHTVASRWNRGRTAPVPLQIANDESLERRIIYKYLGYSPPYQLRRTLDQFGYPEITQMGISARDDDQVLYKRSKERLAAGYRPAKRRENQDFATGHTPRRKSTFRDEQLPAPSTTSKRQEGASWARVISKFFSRYDPEPLKKPSLPNRLTELGEVERMKQANELDVTGLEESTHALDGNMLMVDQLWIRVCQAGEEMPSKASTPGSLSSKRDTLVTFFAQREETSKTENPQFSRYSDLRDAINEQLQDDAIHIEDVWDLAALCVSTAVSVLLDNTSQDEMHIWRIFQEDISDQAEQLTTSLKIFKEESLPDKEIGFSATPATILSRHKAEREKETRKYRANLTALVELRDISDELGILQKLFDQQRKVVEDFKKLILAGTENNQIPAHNSNKIPAHDGPQLPAHNNQRTGLTLLDNAMTKLAEYTEKVQEMKERVTSTREAFEKHLAMVQSQSQVIETRNSRLQADLAGSQGRSLLTFTITTIVFLPLSYFSSLFGMNTSTPINQLSLGSIMAIMFPISAVIICLALVFAFSETVAKSYDGFRRGGSRVWHRIPAVQRARSGSGDAAGSTEEGRGKKRRGVTGHHGHHHDQEDDEDALLTFKNNAFLGNRTKKPYVIPWENLNEEGRAKRRLEQAEQKKIDEAQKRRERREGRERMEDA